MAIFGRFWPKNTHFLQFCTLPHLRPFFCKNLQKIKITKIRPRRRGRWVLGVPTVRFSNWVPNVIYDVSRRVKKFIFFTEKFFKIIKKCLQRCSSNASKTKIYASRTKSLGLQTWRSLVFIIFKIFLFTYSLLFFIPRSVD